MSDLIDLSEWHLRGIIHVMHYDIIGPVSELEIMPNSEVPVFDSPQETPEIHDKDIVLTEPSLQSYSGDPEQWNMHYALILSKQECKFFDPEKYLDSYSTKRQGAYRVQTIRALAHEAYDSAMYVPDVIFDKMSELAPLCVFRTSELSDLLGLH